MDRTQNHKRKRASCPTAWPQYRSEIMRFLEYFDQGMEVLQRVMVLYSMNTARYDFILRHDFILWCMDSLIDKQKLEVWGQAMMQRQQNASLPDTTKE